MAYAPLEANGLNKKLTLEIAYICIYQCCRPFRKKKLLELHGTNGSLDKGVRLIVGHLRFEVGFLTNLKFMLIGIFEL